MGLKAAVQALKKAQPLKDKVQRCKDLLNDNDAWVCQQQLQRIYQRVLILDLEYALDRKVEQELWNLGFKNYIATLQSQAKDKKNPKRGESQALLGWCLEAASGFYLTLLQEICTAFDLDLPFRRKGYVYGCTSPWKAVEKLSVPHKSSCFYACQYCLVHLGDIARYRNENKQAELFYRHAVSLSPSSGQPYNQLALLEASRGNKLGTVFHYARSVAVKHPFPVASANLAKTLSSALSDNSFNINGKTKLNSQEYVAVFLKLHGILHNLGDLKVASLYVKLLTETLTALVATESFDSWMLVQMLVINLYALQHSAGTSTDCTDLLKVEELSTDEKIARNCILDLIAGSLSALLLPVYTIKNSIADYFALPSIKLCLEWIRVRPMVLEEVAFTSRLQIWPGLCVLLNSLQNCVMDFDYERYSKVPLPEDRDLQGFLPLEKSFENLKFTNTELDGDTATLNKLRMIRILDLGHYLARHQINGTTLISFTGDEKKQDGKFTSVSDSAGPSNELMKELEELRLNKQKRFATSPNLTALKSNNSKNTPSSNITEANINDNAAERRVGILKVQNSSERIKDPLSNNSEATIAELNFLPSTRKPRQNVAMQAIIRRAETEQKQVTFKNISPVVVDETNDRKLKLNDSQVKNGASDIEETAASVMELSKVKTVTSAITNADTVMDIQSQQGNRFEALLSKVKTSSPNRTAIASIQSQSTAKLQTAPINHGIQMNQVVQANQGVQINPIAQVNRSVQPKDQPSPMLHQFGQQPHNMNPVRYENNQSFNVPNSQFPKNFITTDLPSHVNNLPNHLRVQSQINGILSPSLPQNISNQSRKLQPRVVQSLPPQSLHQSLGMLQPNLGVSSCMQQQQQQQQSVSCISPNSIHLQQITSNQQSMNMQRPNILQNTANQINSSNQTTLINKQNIRFANVTNNIQPIASTLTTYQTNSQSNSMISSPPTNVPPPRMRLEFGQNMFRQNAFGPPPRQQFTPTTTYNSGTVQKNSDVEFPFTEQTVVGIESSKGQQHCTNDYSIFHNYEANATNNYGMWKDTQQHGQAAAPIAWWGVDSGKTREDELNVDVVFQKWPNPPNTESAIERLPMLMSNNYQRNLLLDDKRYANESTFEDVRGYEVDRKSVQSSSIGNTYSLFSGNTWTTVPQTSNVNGNQDQMKARFHQQSLWSGPGPSPLERLLEQQKSLREGGT